MNNFKIGDFVRSDTDTLYVGIIVDKTKHGFEVAWHDGDLTFHETHRSMSLYEIQPSDWTPELYKAFSDFFCP